MPARTMHLNLQGVGCRGDGTCSNANVTDTQLRLTVDSKNTFNTIERTGGNNFGRTANHDFLCRLENETQRSGQRVLLVVLSHGQCRRERNRGVKIMPAGMHDAIVGAGKLQPRGLCNWKRVYVTAEGETPWEFTSGVTTGEFVFTNVNHQAGVGKQHWFQPCSTQLLLHKSRGGVLHVR